MPFPLLQVLTGRAPLSIHKALGLMLAWVVLPLAIGSVAMVVAYWRSERDDADQRLQSLADSLAYAVDLQVGHGRAQLEAIAAFPDIGTGGDLRPLYTYASDVVRDRPGTLVALTAPDGQLLFITAQPLEAKLPNLWELEARHPTTQWQGVSMPVSSQGMTRRVFTEGHASYSDLYIAVTLGRPTMALAIPVRRDGRVVAALTMSYPAADFGRVITQAGLPPRSRVLVLDKAGRLVAAAGTAAWAVGSQPELPPALRGDGRAAGATLSEPGAAGLRAAVAHTDNGLRVIAALPQGVALKGAQDVAGGWALLFLGALALTTLAARRMGRRLGQPLLALARGAHASQPPSLPPSGIREIDRLSEALQRAAQVDQQRQAEQMRRLAAEQAQAVTRASEERLRGIFDRLYVFVGILDPQGTLAEANMAPIERAGLRREDVIGKPFWDCHWWSYDAKVQQWMREAVGQAAAGGTVRRDIEVRLEAGRLVTIDFQLSGIPGPDGRAQQLIASGVDVEARVHAAAALKARELEARESARRLDEQRALLDAMLEATPAGIILCDAKGRLLRMNRAVREAWGPAPYASGVEDYAAWKGRWSLGHERAGQPVQAHEWPLARVLQTGRSDSAVIDIETFDDPPVRRTLLLSAAAVLDSEGRVSGGVVSQVDITDRVRAEAALREADRHKDEFLATLGHELRNPLAPIRSAAEILRRKLPAGEPALARAQGIIERQVEHMARLVDDLLDVSRITRGLIRLRKDVVQLQPVLAAALDASAGQAGAAGVQLQAQIDDEPMHVLGDATRLLQIVQNLLNNACKFTPAGGQVRLLLRRDGAHALVAVEDDGVGIAPDALERIFGLFVQERPSGEGGNTGLGIGLALSRQLARMHGGELAAHSGGPGSGSVFTLRLPLAPSGAGAAHALPAPAAARPVDAPTSTAAPVDPPAGAAPAAPRSVPLVLVVDDNRDGCDVLCELLGLSGYDPVAAYDGTGALEAARRLRPAAVVLDIGLPDISGYETCRRIRAEQGDWPVIVALTGWGQSQDKDAALAAGFNAHVTKPADPAALADLLAVLLAAQRPPATALAQPAGG